MATQFSGSTILTHIADYDIVEQIYEGSRTVVYRAVQPANQQPVVIKVLRSEHPSFSELVQFRNQYAIAANLDIPGIVQPLSLAPHSNGYVLIMEDVGGISLRQFARGQSLTVEQFFPIALQVIDILQPLHQQRVIHKDIKPANILIQPETLDIKLIDFSIASLLPRETQEIQNPNGLEGTLAYLSPEQTGRMNRGIDYRSDFYSLGVTFFELLTGQLPFQTNDPMELLHCHLAKPPASVCEVNPNLPFMLGEVIRKLMAKNAEDRYQSALGLKHDLLQCQADSLGTGQHVRFELGERDVSDRFLIPEKLYGREAEVQMLIQAFDRVADGASELMLVAGFSGIGKTAVVNEVHKPIVRQCGYFIKGKFDQFNRNIPLSAFVQAFRDLMGQLLSESDDQLAQWRTQILAAVGENGQVLIEVIPELEQIIGQQPDAPELSGSAAQNRFNLLFQRFIAIFTTPEHPLVVFLDDLQWADLASLDLLKLLMSEGDLRHLFIIGAYRDNEVFPAHPLMLALDEIQKSHATVEALTLAPLSKSDVNQLIADTLSCTSDLALPLTELVYQKTGGNPFFTTQFLKALQEDGLILFDWEVGSWQCDLATVHSLALTDDVVEFMAQQLQKLPLNTQHILKLAACIGAQFDLNTLAIVSQQSPTDTAAGLWKALEEGLILPIAETYKFFQGNDTVPSAQALAVPYKFLHDRVQQAAYSLIPETQKQTTHYKIGRLLLENTPPEDREERIFELVGQLNYGIDTIDQAEEKEELAHLNLIACHKAKNATAYRAGREYACKGFSLLGNNPWQEQYEITLALSELATEFAALCGEWEEMDRLVGEVVANSHSRVERANVYRIQIQANVSRNQPTEAVEIALSFLQQLGVTFPENPTFTDIGKAIAAVQELMAEREIEDLLDLPEMKDGEKIAIMQTANSILPATYICKPLLFPIFACLSVSLSIQYGNISPSSYAYVSYGLILSNSANPDVITGGRFCQLALKLVDKFDAKIDKAAVLAVSGLFLIHRTSPLRETRPLLQAAYTNGLETGSYEFAGYGGYNLCAYSFWCNHPLAPLAEETRAYCHGLTQINQLTTANYARIYWQGILNCLGRAENPTVLSGEAMEEREALLQWQAASDGCGLFFFHTYKLMLCYLFGEIKSARNHGIEARHYLMAGTGFVVEPVFYFYDSLTMLAPLNSNSEEITHIFENVKHNQRILQEKWANYAPMNHQHKVDLVEAEQCRVSGEILEATALYDKAIAGAKANEYIQEEALANELAAKFYLDWGRERIAQDYMIEAYYGYARWGAKAKLADLETRYPQLLAPILQPTHTPLSVSETVFASGTVVSHSTSSTSISDSLDLSAVLKASQAISSEIELDQLVATLLTTVVQMSGANQCVLMLQDGSDLTVQARAELTELGPIETQVLHPPVPLSDSQSVPISLVNTVKRHLEPAVITDATQHPQLIGDVYIQTQQPKSLLCYPILHQGKLLGMVYLENNLATGAFTRDRVELLNLLCAQAAVSLENARLYQQAQTYAQQLEESQLQIVQNEKMATLGNLVAGVAHEINNPVGFLNGSINNAKDHVQDLFEHLETYQAQQPPNDTVQESAEDIDLEFLCEDLPKLLNSMKGATDRIKGISTSLRTFSRADTEHKISANLLEGLDSTLLILKYRLKANDQRPAIKVIKDYGELPEIDCFPGQLNQVFMNVLANAIDALDEASQHRTMADLKAHPQQIAIRTGVNENWVKITIADNGPGIPADIQAKIFNHLFTTKGVGKGTGLGLAIARQIVEDTHGGSLAVHSEAGQGTEFRIQLPLS
jgi:predicted ATPase/signal transduction histidine kinase